MNNVFDHTPLLESTPPFPGKHSPFLESTPFSGRNPPFLESNPFFRKVPPFSGKQSPSYSPLLHFQFSVATVTLTNMQCKTDVSTLFPTCSTLNLASFSHSRTAASNRASTLFPSRNPTCSTLNLAESFELIISASQQPITHFFLTA